MTKEPLEFGGVERFAAPPDRVFAVVTDLGVLSRVLPDVESSQQPDADTLRCVVRPGFSFLRGKLNVTIRRQAADAAEPLAARFRVESKAIGVEIVVETSLRVEAAAAAASDLHWQAAVIHRKGLVAAVSTALIRAAAEKVIEQTWQRLGVELGSR